MKFLSTTEAATIWKISPRRVALLASQGRIEGAVSMGNYWLIPQDAKKPEDLRKRGVKKAPDDNEKYVFPFLLVCVHSSEQVEQFSPEETELYRVCMLFETGDFIATRQCAEGLLNAKNIYVRLSALYHLTTTCMYLFDFESAQRYYVLFSAEVHGLLDHQAEMQLLLDELDAEFVSASEYSKKVTSYDLSNFSNDLLPTICSWKFFADLTETFRGTGNIDIFNYELSCRSINAQGYFFNGMCMHAYLSAYYAKMGLYEKELQHMKEAVAIGVTHGTVFTLAYMIATNPDTARVVLSEYSPELIQRFTDLSQLFTSARNAYTEYQGKSTVLSILNEEDYKLICMCLKEYSVDKMAEIYGLSRSGMNKRLSNLYYKIGVESKRELIEVAFRALLK